jgi:epidermal growth factor receptor substrate 15
MATGVNAFDEAMGKFSGTNSPATAQFTFETAFDDNFDFPAATANPFPPPPTAMNGRAASITRPAANKNDALDKITATSAVTSLALPRETEKPDLLGDGITASPSTQPISQGPAGVSFEEAFSGFESGPSLNLNSSFASPPQAVSTESPTQKSFSAVSTSTLPKSGPSSPGPAAARPASPPPRATTPPRRVSSPKVRSGSSPKEEKQKDPPPRHSKLSVSCFDLYDHNQAQLYFFPLDPLTIW